MKKILTISAVLCLLTIMGHAQDEDVSEKGFKKENLFTGGSLTLSFFNGQTVLGANPVLGYKIAEWLDAGVAFNFLYNGARDYYEYNDKLRQTVLGPGVFARVYPVRFLFAQAQLENNFSTLKYKPSDGSSGVERYTEKNSTPSLLVGAGFAQGREPGSNTFYYISLLFDVLKDINSPYVNVTYNPNNPADRRVTLAPIIRAGINIGLFEGRYSRR